MSTAALANARDLMSVERSLSIFHEGAVQDAFSALHGPDACRLDPARRDLGFRALRGRSLRWVFAAGARS
jgi:hypothetical protein